MIALLDRGLGEVWCLDIVRTFVILRLYGQTK